MYDKQYSTFYKKEYLHEIMLLSCKIITEIPLIYYKKYNTIAKY